MIYMFKAILYFYPIYLKTLEICALKYTNLILKNDMFKAILYFYPIYLIYQLDPKKLFSAPGSA